MTYHTITYIVWSLFCIYSARCLSHIYLRFDPPFFSRSSGYEPAPSLRTYPDVEEGPVRAWHLVKLLRAGQVLNKLPWLLTF